jgi:hypothetical protein
MPPIKKVVSYKDVCCVESTDVYDGLYAWLRRICYLLRYVYQYVGIFHRNKHLTMK